MLYFTYKEMMHILKSSLLLIVLLSMVIISCAVIVEEDVSNEVVETVFPTDSAIVYEGDIEFKWLPMFGASGYELLIVSPDFANASNLAVDTVLEDATSFQASLTPNTYEWMITGINSGYSSDPVIGSFEVVDSSFFVNVSDVIPKLRVPAPEQEITDDSEVLFNWEKIELVTTYNLLVVSNTLESPIDVITDTTLTDVNNIKLTLDNGRYEWSLSGQNPFSQTLVAQRSFTVDVEEEEVEEEVEDTDAENLSSF